MANDPHSVIRLRNDPLWYKDAVIYEVYVRAFYDSTGDGNGDFKGLIEKLDYLKWLGVDCLWLLPMFPSPLKDGGYDIADYNNILPDYGTLDDFKAFLDASHARGIRVIIELVVNHTSDQHPWFQEARSDPNSPKRDWYVWSDTPEKYKDARIIFVDTERSNWTWDDEAKAFFWHRFFSHQPDLNFDNPEVQDAMLEVVAFWLDLGVDGFRVDAVPYLIEREGTNCENLPETHDFCRKLRTFIDERYPARVLLAEANQWPSDVIKYMGEGDEFHMAFHFPLMPRLFMALRKESARPITDILAQTPEIPANCQWGTFLRNHDELTLEMCSTEERDYLYAEYARDKRMRCNIGIRRRLASLMENNRRSIELLYGLLFSLPGSPIIYYGDEIGMGDNVYLGDRDGVRTPMQWSGDRNGGFSRADYNQIYFPLIMDPVYGYQAVNVEAQQRHASSLLHWLRRLIHMRQSTKVFSRGDISILRPHNERIFAFVRTYQNEVALCINNLSHNPQPVVLELGLFDGRTPVALMGEVPFPVITTAPYHLSLDPHGFIWLKLVEKT